MFTPGLERLVHTIRSARRTGRIVFPPRLIEGGARRKDGEHADAWLRRCAESLGGIEHVVVEENLVLFVSVHLENSKITYANLQAMWAEIPLARFAVGATARHRYLRLDHDSTALGPLLKEPLPHVHVEPDGEPRFPVPAADCDVVGWFLDFVYRNFFYDEWIEWAERAWDEWCRERKRSNRWRRLLEAFKQSKIGVLEADPALREDFVQLKHCLLTKRKTLFPFEVDAARAALFGHHAG